MNAIKERIASLTAEGAGEVLKAMQDAGVYALSLTNSNYDGVYIGTEDNSLSRVDAVFQHEGNLYAYTSEVGEEGSENALKRLFEGRDYTTDKGEAYGFVENTDFPLYNILDDTTAPSETVSELLTTVPTLLDANGL